MKKGISVTLGELHNSWPRPYRRLRRYTSSAHYKPLALNVTYFLEKRVSGKLL